LWPYVQMNPALQGKKHRLELIKALKEGIIDFIATDHAPHTLNEKFTNFNGSEENYKNLLCQDITKCRSLSCLNGTSGTPQLDSFALITTWLMKNHGFSPRDIARVACENPGKFSGRFLRTKIGRIEVGYSGSFTIIDMSKPTIFERKDVRSKVGWSPFEGVEFPGTVHMTIIDGKVCYKKEEKM